MRTRETPGVCVEEVALRAETIEGVALSDAVFIGECSTGAENEPTPVASHAAFEANFGPTAKGGRSHRSGLMSCAVRGFFDNGGDRAWVVRVAADSHHAHGHRQWSLADIDGVGAVCLPGHPWAGNSKKFIRVWLDAVETSRHALLIIDPPSGVELRTAADVQALDLPTSKHAVTYYPWVRVKRGKHPRETVLVPPSGHIAGVWARTGETRGVWKAPAGLEARLNGVTGLEFEVNDSTQGVLNPLGINALRKMPGRETLVWGARTLAAASDPEWKYINIRRFTNYIEHSIEAGMRWVVFEPNGEALWMTIKRSVETFLFGLFRQGSLVGTKPEDAFFVRCDSSTMTPNDIVNGIVNIFAGFAPIKPAEFVVLRISQKTARSKR